MLRRSARILGRTIPSTSKVLPKNFSTSNLAVKHDGSAKMFYVSLDDTEERAVIEYEEIDAKTLNLYHTEVPIVFRGLGVAQILAKAAFEHCVRNDFKMQLGCDYLQKYYRDNPLPEYTSLMLSSKI